LLETRKLIFYQELLQKVPAELISLMNIAGLGPKKLKKIHDAWG